MTRINQDLHDEIRKLRSVNPSWSIRKIALEADTNHTTVMRALDPDFAQRVKDRKRSEYIAKNGSVGVCSVCSGPLDRRTNRSGICQNTPECVTARRRAYDRTRSPLARAKRRTPEGWCQVQSRICRAKHPESTVDAPYLLALWNNGHCPCCNVQYQIGDETTRLVSPSLDKIYPGRGYIKGNVRIICQQCNSRKREMSSADLLRMYLDTVDAEAWADSWNEAS